MKPANQVLTALVMIFVLACSLAVPAAAMQTPSKTAVDQSLEQREVDLAKVQSVVAQPEVTEVIARQGFTTDEVNARLAQLSAEEIHTLSTQLDLLQAAGAGVPNWIWILIGVALGVWIITAI